MALRNVVLMTDAEREQRRENDELCFMRVHAEIAEGTKRSAAFSRVASAMGVARNDVIAGYWRHDRRSRA